MADESPSSTIRAIHWREVFPFVHLFRAFRVAVHPSKLVLALVALTCIYTGGRVLDWCWPHSYRVTVDEVLIVQTPEEVLNGLPATTVLTEQRFPIFDVFFKYEITQAENAINSFVGVTPRAQLNENSALTWRSGFDSIWNFIAVGPGWLWWSHWFFALLFTAWFLLVWSLFGGAISRIAAVHVARDEKISVRQAVRFSSNKILSFIFAPLIPLLIVFGIGITLSAISWALFHLSHPGAIIAGLLYIFALLGGLVMTLVLLGTLGGFNLMYPTIGVEGSDSFDAISRSFSYVFARPWRMLWYTLVTLVYGAICYLFVKFFIYLILVLTQFFVGWWLHSKQVGPVWNDIFPTISFQALTYHPAYRSLRWPEDVAATEIAFWNYLVISMLGAFAISFYFSANTIIYYLMRREVDATELEDVYREEADDELTDTAPLTAAPTGPTVVTGSTTAVVTEVVPITPPGSGATDAPGGGVTDTAGSSPPGEATPPPETPPGT